MARTLSQDLRDRVVAVIDGGIHLQPVFWTVFGWKNPVIALLPNLGPLRSRVFRPCALLLNLGPLGPGVFRLAQVRWAGFTG
jgi:hypothetical protein